MPARKEELSHFSTWHAHPSGHCAPYRSPLRELAVAIGIGSRMRCGYLASVLALRSVVQPLKRHSKLAPLFPYQRVQQHDLP
jgi:hypothetical protein